ncbi:MAG: lysine biosynthesis protein LysW [Candidatus Aminicenantes bacterium]|nr:lysine biosynthesis protein LysW [Candidatus Aminicenantes bacterium]
MNQKNAGCPVCGADVIFDEDIVNGELVVCSECGLELEVTSTSPLILKEAPQEAEDWGE